MAPRRIGNHHMVCSSFPTCDSLAAVHFSRPSRRPFASGAAQIGSQLLRRFCCAESGPAKTPFVSAKGPTVSAWSQAKDWAAVAAPPEPVPVSESVKFAAPSADDSAEMAVQVPSVPRNGRGRGGSGRDRGSKNRDAETFGEAATRGKGKGRRDGRPMAEPATDDCTPTDLPLDIPQAEPSMELPLPSGESTELPIPALPTPSELPKLPVSADMGSAVQASDPAIMMVGSGTPPDASCFPATDTGGGLMPSLLGGSGPNFAAFEAAPAAATTGGKQFLSGFDDIVPAPSLDSICQPSAAAACSLTSPPVSLPLPASLVTALPGAAGGTSPLPGFCVGSGTTDAGSLEAPEQLAGGFQQLSVGSDRLPSSTTTEAFPGGILPAGMLQPGAGLAPTSSLPSVDGLSGMAPNALSPIPTQAMNEPSRAQSRARSAQIPSAVPQPLHAPTPPGMQPPVGLLEPIGCTPSGTCTDDARIGPPLVTQSMQPLMQAAPAQMDSYGMQTMGPPGYDLPMHAPVLPAGGRGNSSEKEGRSSRNSRNNKKKANCGRDGGNGTFNSMPSDPLSLSGGASMMPPGLGANGAGVVAMRMGGEMPASASPGAGGMLPPQQFGPPSGIQQQYFVSPMAPSMPNYGCYGAPMGIGGACAYAPPAGMYQQTQPTGIPNIYQAPQYTQQQPPQPYVSQQAHVPQQPQYVPQPQQPFGMQQQSSTGTAGYAYQAPMGGMGGIGAAGGAGGGATGGFGGGFGGGGMGGQPFNTGAPYGAYDDGESYSNQQGNMYAGAPPANYYRSS
mmetsp:Transcript_43405/g.127683  ORF Transcript_43405/g.127683 Transcript_43405/m.127683 type:complete len:786 (-) Transcript_43405:514-2871(-)